MVKPPLITPYSAISDRSFTVAKFIMFSYPKKTIIPPFPVISTKFHLRGMTRAL